jgi:hypothetical protein
MFSVGGDPEFFILRDGVPVSAHDLLPGSKEKPHPLQHGDVQVDGMAGEVNIKPSTSAEEFEHNVRAVFSDVKKILPKWAKIAFKPSVEFLDSTLEAVPESQKELGCSPDFNAYTGLMNESPMLELKKVPNLRSAGGHICVGWGDGFDKKDASHVFDCESFIKHIDPVYRGFAAIWDNDQRRASLYGKPGAYRTTSFGVEYRTPSNAWVAHPKMYPFIFALAENTMLHMMGEEQQSTLTFKHEWING